MPIFQNPQWLANRVLLLLCLVLPWLNPFTSAPSSSVIPLLLSWMLVACALLLVVDEPLSKPAVGKALSDGQRQWRVATLPWGVLLLGWFGAALVTVPQVIDRALTAGVVAACACIWIAIQMGKRAAQPNNGLLVWVLAAWLLAALLSSVLAVLQYLDMARELAPWVNQPRAGEAFANLRQRNQFASLTSIGLIALFGLVAMAPNYAQRYAVWVWAALALLAAGVSCSASRTGTLEWGVLFLWVAWWWQRRKDVPPMFMQLAVVALVFLTIWTLAMPWFALHLKGIEGSSVWLRMAQHLQNDAPCAGRRVLWDNVLQMLVQRPWLGWGLGETDFAYYSTNFNGERFCELVDNAHNFPLHMALEFGVPFTLACAAWVLFILQKYRVWHMPRVEQRIAFAVMLILGIHSMLEYPLWYGPFQITLGLALGLWMGCIAQPDPQASAHSPSREAIVCAVLFLACLYAAWEYNRVAQVYRPAALRDAAYRDNPLQSAETAWLFKNQVDFANLMTRTITVDNAVDSYDLAMRVLHYSPEPRVVARAVESLQKLGRLEQAEALSRRMETTAPSK